MKVRKRDGIIKAFDFSKITNAVKVSYLEVFAGDTTMFHKDYPIVEHLIKEKLDTLEEEVVDIERIQDIVVESLNRVCKTVSKAYQDYREERTIQRENKSKMLNDILGLVDNTNTAVLLENSNKKSQLASTQRDLIAGEVSKHVAKTIMIPNHLIKAHERGAIKIHDLDYYLQNLYNCELLDLEDMLQNGTVINGRKINKPRSIRTAMTITTQISAQVSSSTYGGQTITLTHLAPFVRVSKEKLEKEYKLKNERLKLNLTKEQLEELVRMDLNTEVKDAVQTLNYQINTLMTTNGQSPFISIAIYLNENPEYSEEVAMLAKEIFKQRYEGMENEYGIKVTQTFPKLLYFLDENNIHEDSEYYWLTEEAVKCVSLRMNPDFISVKKMKEVIGFAFPAMGCRAFLSPFKDKNGEYKFYGRGNLGVCTLNLPFIALESGGDINEFWKLLDHYMEYVRQVGELRYEKLRGAKASVAPILWQHGAIARLKPEEPILKAIDEKGFTVTMGYSGIYETVKYLTGKSHTTEEGFKLAETIMKKLRDTCEKFKANQPHLRFALYGTPAESTTEAFNNAILREFGEVKDITKGYIINSYHVDIREEIDAFRKLKIEGELQKYSTGGAVSYVETYNMQKNPQALMQLVKYMYDTIMYAEINFESDSCGECGYTGVMDNDADTLDWVCPQCGNRNQESLSVVRRTCGYLAETNWTKGRKLDILNRVKHL